MKDGWDIKKLGEVCLITMGQSPNSESYNKLGDGLPFFQGCSDFGAIHPLVTTWCNQPNKIANPNDILMSVRAPIGTLNIADSKCCIGRGLAAFTQKEGVTINKFLYYFLLSSKGDLQSKGTGATFKAIGKELIKNYAIKLPSLTEQQHIVEELDLLSSIIEKKKAQLNELDNLAQSLFYEMFGDPISNEKGWKLSTFNHEFEVTSGGTPSTRKKEYWDNGTISWIGSNMCQNKILSDNDGKYITKEGLKHSSAKLYYKGFVLVALVGATIGKCALLNFDTTTNQNIAGINVPSNKYFEPYFVFFTLQSLYSLFQNIGEGKFKMANLSFVRSLPIIKPPLDLQQRFAKKVKSIEHQKELIKLSIKEVETLFNSRMDYYFN